MKTQSTKTLPLALAALAINLFVIQSASGSSFLTSRPLLTSRSSHTATLLPNGLVLVAGGFGTNSLSNAELYDPATGTWTTTSSMTTPHFGHTATLLPNGEVLVAAGYGSISYINSAELYDP